MVKALSRRAVDSATIKVVPSGVIAMPLGKSRCSATTVTWSSGSIRTITPPPTLPVAALAPDAGLGSNIGAAVLVDHHVTEGCGDQVAEISQQFDGVAVVTQHLAALGGHDQQGAVGPEAQPGRRMSGYRQGGHGA